MTDATDGSTETAAEPTATAPQSFGPALATAREALGVSPAEIAGRLRLHPRQIAALESEQLELLPAPTFVRGFIRNYAKELRLDPAPLLASFEARIGPTARVSTIGQGPSKIVQAAERERISRQLVILGGIGLLIALGAIGWLASHRPNTAPTPPPSVPSAAPTAGAPPAPATEQPAAGAAAAGGAQAEPSSAAPPLATQAESPAPRSESGDAARPAPAVATGGPLLRIATGDRPSWIEVVQVSDGRVVYSGLAEANGERRLAVVPPVRVTVGNASSVKLEYRGKPVDLGPSVRDDVARLTLE